VADVVRAIQGLMACPSARGKVFNLGNDEPITINGLAERVARQVNTRLAIHHVPYSDVFGSEFEEIRRRVPHLTRVRKTICYQPRYGLDDIICDVIAWKQRQQAGQTVKKSKSAAFLAPPPGVLMTASS
jgi:UDP-glucose 4-epimerase